MIDRKYICLSQQNYDHQGYSLVPIRDFDKYSIMDWRNEQILILRQAQPLTTASQEKYFQQVIAPLFETPHPQQILFSVLLNGQLIGYGGLVHMDWGSHHGEISFLTETSRSKDFVLFEKDWLAFLEMIKKMAFIDLKFSKIYTYAYSLRKNLFPILEASGFSKEASLIDHVVIDGKTFDVVIHSIFSEALLPVRYEDAGLLLEWRNDPETRKNSFSSGEISMETHLNWLQKKLLDNKSRLLIYQQLEKKIGQVRLDFTNEQVTVNYLISPNFRGQGMGTKIILLAEKWVLKEGFKKIVAEVKDDNGASIRIFTKLGYQVTQKEGFKIFTKVWHQ